VANKLGDCLTSDQERFWNILKFDAKTMAIELGSVMENARVKYGDNSKDFHSTVNRCLFMVLDQAHNEFDVIKIVRHWLTTSELPIDPNQLESYDIFHHRYASLIFELINTKHGRACMEWN
jgi:hypothetical protein